MLESATYDDVRAACSNLAKANEQRDWRIFEEFAYYMIGEARKRRKTDIFNLGGSVYAFDSTTIDLCLSVFWWAKFRRKKGGIKVHTLYDIETQIPAFLHITTTSVHDVKAIPEIPLEAGAYYIFDRGYNDFANLTKINAIGARFVVRVRSNLRYERVSWERRLAKGVRSDSVIRFSVYKSARDYPGELRRVAYHVPQPLTSGVVLQMAKTAPADKEVLGHHGERRAHPNILCHNHLLPSGDSATQICNWSAASTKCFRFSVSH